MNPKYFITLVIAGIIASGVLLAAELLNEELSNFWIIIVSLLSLAIARLTTKILI
ncbi:MAG: hypothetical protein P1P88_04975 [Bacteroidales bacterium]|nr:hypothetical protein [Bacteroidales bacterium]